MKEKFLLLLGFSILTNKLILFFAKSKKIYDIDKGKKHAVHKGPVPRIGGLSIFLVFFFVSLLNFFQFWRLLILASSAFAVGFVEDLRKDISPKIRLLLLFIISTFSVLLLDVRINDVGFFKIPLFIAYFLTIVAIAGFTNAINIVDGLNGLASGISATFLLFLGVTFNEYGYVSLAFLSFSIVAGIIGFLIFNFPYGKIFLGDGGAYFIGFICAILSIKLVNLIPDISPWFPFILGVYPVWEVFFSAYRRWKKGKHPFYPDRLHFHTLLFYRFAGSNPMASFLILCGNLMFSLVAFLLKECTICLVVEFFLFIAIYFTVYRWLTRTSFAGSLDK